MPTLLPLASLVFANFANAPAERITDAHAWTEQLIRAARAA
jgi:hypothetical protein